MSTVRQPPQSFKGTDMICHRFDLYPLKVGLELQWLGLGFPAFCYLDSPSSVDPPRWLYRKDNYIDPAHARSISACNVLLTERMCYVRVSSSVSGRVRVSSRVIGRVSSRVRFCARSTTYYTHLSTVRAHGQQHRAYRKSSRPHSAFKSV